MNTPGNRCQRVRAALASARHDRRMGSAAVTCPRCGVEATRASAQYCDACGAPIAATREPAEYKQVTVLFADVVRSMDIASTLDPERFREVMAAVFNRSAVVVRRYGGTVDKFTGDGIMALFGAPLALEDHALRGCMAALAIQQEIERLAADVAAGDAVTLQLRVGLNSGKVVAGDIGSGTSSYTAFGEHVGMAQRMESIAPAGGVMVSESTARLVENVAVLSEPMVVRVKGSDKPVRARQLFKTVADPVLAGRQEWTLVGRQWEMQALAGMLDESIAGRGSVVRVVGVAGIGKTRLTREIAAMANERGVEVLSTFCESHSTDVPFHVIGRLLRSVLRVSDLQGAEARAVVRARFADADADDVLLLEDLTGIRDSDVGLPDIAPDARSRRLTRLISTALLARQAPAMYVIEDAHWIDEVSETMLAEFLQVIPRTHSMVVITYRPHYTGVLNRTPGAQTIYLAPLGEQDASALTVEMLGCDPSVQTLAARVTERAAGNPFFAQEIVRDLVERGVLDGDRGAYTCCGDATDLSVPPTIAATIAARIDRLPARAKRTLNAAAVIGSPFDEQTLMSLVDDVALADLVGAELVDQIVFTPHAEYAFRHPLIRAVAYESQLKSGRAELHRRLADAIQRRDPESVDEYAALIATHLEAAGELRAAYGWHMRAGSWSTHRDIVAARASWQRARQVADRLPATDPKRTSMRIAPRTLLCGTAWRIGGSGAGTEFAELRELTTAAGDKVSLAAGMAGLVMALTFDARYRESSRLASECVDVIESIGDPATAVALLGAPIHAKFQAGEVVEALHLAQRIIDLAAGDATMGNLTIGSPLAMATADKAAAKYCLGMPGWADDFDDAIAMGRAFDATTSVIAICQKYCSIGNNALLPDADALRDTAEALQIAELSADHFNLALARLARALVVTAAGGRDRQAGFELFAAAREAVVQQRCTLSALPLIDSEIAKEKARAGDLGGAVELAQTVVDDEFATGEMIWRGRAVTVLVELLLQRRGAGDVRQAQAAIDRLAAVPTDPGFVLHGIPLLRLRALLAQQCGDRLGHRRWADRYRAKAAACGFKGHLAMADTMT